MGSKITFEEYKQRRIDACKDDTEKLLHVLEDIHAGEFALFVGAIRLPYDSNSVRFCHVEKVQNFITGENVEFPYQCEKSLSVYFHRGTKNVEQGDRILFTVSLGNAFLPDAKKENLLRVNKYILLNDLFSRETLAKVVSVIYGELLDTLPNLATIGFVNQTEDLAEKICSLHQESKNQSANLEKMTRLSSLLEDPEILAVQSKQADNINETIQKLNENPLPVSEQLSSIATVLDRLKTESIPSQDTIRTIEGILNQLQSRELPSNDELSNKLVLLLQLEEKCRRIKPIFPSVLQQQKTKPIKENVILYEHFKERLDHDYEESIVIPFLMGLSTNQIITLFGPPGQGKTTLVKKMAKAIGAKCTTISVQSNWTDSNDLLGYYNPVQKTYESTRFIDALIDANNEWESKKENSRIHIICLDEMNLARIEYYFASFLSILQLEDEDGETDTIIRLLPSYIEDGFQKVYSEKKGKSAGEDSLEKADFSEEEQYLWSLMKYHQFALPPNVRFVGTLNNDHTTNELSPKVRDRCLFINLASVSQSEDRKIEIDDYYPVSFFKPNYGYRKYLPDDFVNENNRFKHYADLMLSWVYDHLPDYRDGEYKLKSIIYNYLIMTKILPLLRKKDEFAYGNYTDADNMFNERADNTPGDNFDLLGGY